MLKYKQSLYFSSREKRKTIQEVAICAVVDGGKWVEEQQKSVFFFIYSCSINMFCVCRRGEQGLVTETPRGEIQIPQRSGKMVADTIVLEFFSLILLPLFIR